MADRPSSTPPEQVKTFAEHAEEKADGLFAEMWGFLRHNKKWWLIPIIAAPFAVGILGVLSGTAVAPFIYTLF